MVSELVARLRAFAKKWPERPEDGRLSIADEAAGRIESLSRQLEEAREALKHAEEQAAHCSLGFAVKADISGALAELNNILIQARAKEVSRG